MPLFADSPDLAKTRGREILVNSGAIALKFRSRLGSSAAETPVKFHNDTIM